MSGADEEWVKAAMTDDAMVVELLVRIHKSPAPRLPSLKNKAAEVPLVWSVRQRRSKAITISSNPKKPAHQSSPTTTLSWSGAASFSGGSEESSRPMAAKVACIARSKASINSSKITSKRSRKKTLPELKEEEISLMKERRDLKRELATLRKDLERQKATNEKLKRMKVQLHYSLVEVKPHLKSMPSAEESTSSQPPQEEVTAASGDVASNAHLTETTYAATDCKFVLPDLNIAFDEPGICGVS